MLPQELGVLAKCQTSCRPKNNLEEILLLSLRCGYSDVMIEALLSSCGATTYCTQCPNFEECDTFYSYHCYLRNYVTIQIFGKTSSKLRARIYKTG